MKELNQKEMLMLDGGGYAFDSVFIDQTKDYYNLKAKARKLEEKLRRFELANGVTSKNSMQRTSY